MTIDDPVAALQRLNDSDERQRFPMGRFATPFMKIVELFAPPGAELPLTGIAAAFDWLDRRSAENLKELVDILASELKGRGSQIEKLMRDSQEHRDFVNEELPGLVLDAIRRAEGIRAKDRIKRLGRILVRAAEMGPLKSSDHAEEMLRIATELSELDVLVLHEHVKVQGARMRADIGRVTHYDAYTENHNILVRLQAAALRQGEIDSSCAKLESFGLVSRTERTVNVMANDPTPYALLQKGLDFVDYIKATEDR